MFFFLLFFSPPSISGFCDELTRNRVLMLILSVVSLILFHQHVAGHPERHFRGLWAASREQRRDDSLDALMAAARAGGVSSLVSHRRFSFGYPSVEPRTRNPVGGLWDCVCGCGIKGPVSKMWFNLCFFLCWLKPVMHPINT